MKVIKRKFIRVLWGITDIKYIASLGKYLPNKVYYQRNKITNDILLSKMNKYEVDFIVYVFGEDNYKYLIDQGFNCKLLDKREVVWDMRKEQYRHKLEAVKCGIEEFDEIVFIDWDTVAIRPITDLFWDNFYKKQAIQATLRTYRKNISAFWREQDKIFIPCASFIYLRDKNIIYDMIKFWETLEYKWSEEVSIAKITDDIIGGWKGIETYWENFEPDSFRLFKARVFPWERILKKDVFFEHFWVQDVDKLLKHTSDYNKKIGYSWLLTK